MRIFIGLSLGKKEAKDLGASFKALPLTWSAWHTVSSENFHITLKFLGNTRLDDLEKIRELSEEAASGSAIPIMEFAGGDAFPKKAPKNLVVLFNENDVIRHLHEKLDIALWEQGIASRDNRKFVPHVTLAHLKRGTQVPEMDLLSIQQWKYSACTEESEIVVYQSVSTSHGSQYIPLYTIPL